MFGRLEKLIRNPAFERGFTHRRSEGDLVTITAWSDASSPFRRPGGFQVSIVIYEGDFDDLSGGVAQFHSLPTRPDGLGGIVRSGRLFLFYKNTQTPLSADDRRRIEMWDLRRMAVSSPPTWRCRRSAPKSSPN